jgi:hypothetical protein
MELGSELILLENFRKLEVHLMVLNMLSKKEPITKIDDEAQHLYDMNKHFEQLKTVNSLLWESMDGFYGIEEEELLHHAPWKKD